MRKRLFATMLVAVCCMFAAEAQHMLYLKSGDNLKGEMVGGKRDTVYFKFMGNRLALPMSQINAIYFEEATAPKQIADPYGDCDAKITGYVTDAYMVAEVERPDAGARIYIVDEKDAPGVDYKLVSDTFPGASTVMDIRNQFESNGAAVPAEIQAAMTLYNCDTDDKFEALCRRTNKSISLIRNNKKAMQVSCDDDGKFQMPIKSGTYYILIVSKHTTSKSVVEVSGKVVCRKATIQQNEDYVLPPVRFEVP